MMNRKLPFTLVLILLLTSCNLPALNATPPPTTVEGPTAAGAPVQIQSPHAGETLPAIPVVVQFTATGGPFIEADLLVDGNPVMSLPLDGSSTSTTVVLSWADPTAGVHILTAQVLTPNKEIFSASVQVTVEGAAGGQTPSAPPTVDPGLEAARQRIVQILHDDYGILITNPPVGRKARPGVADDPYTTAIYYKNWLITLSLYPDGTVEHYVYPLNYTDPYVKPSLLKSGDKPIPACRPSGTLKLLVVFVDYGNLNVSGQETSDSLEQAVRQINEKYLEVSQAVGLQTPILQLKATTAYLASPPPAMPDHLLTPDLVRSATGFDPAQFDITVQIDLDAQDLSGLVKKYGTFGFGASGCGPLPNDVNVWIAISQKEQLSPASSDPRLVDTLAHELLHTMGYPIGRNGHEWVCGDGTQPDQADECIQTNLPTLMLGWTDTDGDGVVEILDDTPYGSANP